MKFDYVIGNPPYQDEVESKGDRPNPVYDKFMDSAYEIGEVVELIHPARFLFNAGQTSKKWNEKMLNDEHFKVLNYESDAATVFPSTEIKGGVAITLHNNNKDFGAIRVFTSRLELNGIVKKVMSVHNEEAFLNSIISSRGCYRTTDVFFKEFPDASSRLGKGTGNMIASNFFEKIPEAYTTDEPSDYEAYGMLARINGKRTICYINRKYVRENDYVGGYNVACPKSNGNGIFGEVLTSTEILEPNQGATDTFINIGSFDSLYEAESFSKYFKTKLFRALLGVKKVTQDNPKATWSMIPLQDFTEHSDIDWSQSIHDIDCQLYKKYNLSDEEIDFIETHVKEMN